MSSLSSISRSKCILLSTLASRSLQTSQSIQPSAPLSAEPTSSSTFSSPAPPGSSQGNLLTSLTALHVANSLSHTSPGLYLLDFCKR